MARPNFLFIYIDDLRYMLDDADPHPEVLMPRIKAAQRKGISFDNVQCPKAICTPSRVSLLTGRHVRQTTSRGYSDSFKDKLETFPGVLHDAGYETYAFGKVFDSRSFGKNYNKIDLCRPANTQRGNLCSFDDSFSGARACCISALPVGESKYGYTYAGKEYNGQCRYLDRDDDWVFHASDTVPGKHNRCRNRPNKKQGSIQEKLLLYSGGDVLDHTDYGIANAAIEKVKELASANKTFFVALGFNKPHLSLSAPHRFYDALKDLTFENSPYWTDTFAETLPGPWRPDFSERYSYKQTFGVETEDDDGLRSISVKKNDFDKIRRSYYATVNYIDELTGIVLNELEHHNEQTRTNTHVIITSDHGFLLGEYGRIAKWTLVEATTRVPLIFIPSKASVQKENYNVNTVVSSPVHQVDIFPTVLELAGLQERYVKSNRVAKDRVPGSSLMPYFKDASYFNRAVSVSEYESWSSSGQVFSLRSKYFRYTRAQNSNSRYLFDYRGGGYYRMIERENVFKDKAYKEVRQWFESLWNHPKNDFSSWDFVLDIPPLDMNFSSVRGVNIAVAPQSTDRPTASPSDSPLEQTAAPSQTEQPTTPMAVPTISTEVPTASPSPKPMASSAVTDSPTSETSLAPSNKSGLQTTVPTTPSSLLTQSPTFGQTFTPSKRVNTIPFQESSDGDDVAMTAAITIAVLFGVFFALFAYLQHRRKSAYSAD